MIDPTRIDSMVAFLQPRLWYAFVAGTLVWSIWLGSLLLGGSRVERSPLTIEWGWPSGETDIVGQVVSVDHLAFYSPARLIREGQSARLYDHDFLYEYQRSLFAPGVWNAFEAYRNPPFYALLYVPTSSWSYPASAWFWNVVGLLGLALGLRWLGVHPWRKAYLWGLSFLPVFAVLSYGQNSLLSFTALAGTYRLLADRRVFLAGLVAGLLWFKPPLLLGLIIWGLFDLRRLWPAAVGVVVSGAILTGGSYLIVPEAWTGFFQTLGSNAEFDNFEWWKMHNPRSFGRLLFGKGWATTACWAIGAILGLIGFVRVWQRNREHLPTMFACSTLLMLWVSPHTMIYEWSLALIPAYLLWAHRSTLRPVWVVANTIVWLALFTGTDAGQAQIWIQKQLGISEPYVVQYSVILIGCSGWLVCRALTTPGQSYGFDPVIRKNPEASAS